jgi:membrane protein CcdC involved in cytochrome C biogenesis
MRRIGQVRPLKLGALLVVPAIYFIVSVLMFVALPPTVPVLLASVATLGIGSALGWQRGKMMHIDVDPATQTLNQRASPAAMVFLIILVLIRMALRQLLGHAGAVSPAMLADPLIAFALGMLTLQRAEMYVRAKRLLKQARSRS